MSHGQTRAQKTEEQAKKKDLGSINNFIDHCRSCRFIPDFEKRNRLDTVLKDENGFMDILLLTAYLVIFLTTMAFILGLGFGTMKQAQARYGYLAESMEFASSAANMTGGITGVQENQEMAQEFFEAAMNEMGEDYTLNDFYAVEPGDRVPGGTTAKAPGFVAKVTMPVCVVNVPYLGEQAVEIPMGYYAVAKSEQQ